MYSDTSLAPEQCQNPDGQTFNSAAKMTKWEKVFASIKPPTSRQAVTLKLHYFFQSSILSKVLAARSDSVLQGQNILPIFFHMQHSI